MTSRSAGYELIAILRGMVTAGIAAQSAAEATSTILASGRQCEAIDRNTDRILI
jgi:hypothetical protein